MVTVATGNDNVRLAVDYAVAKATGGKIPTADSFKGPVFEDSVSKQPNGVQCKKDLPGDVYLSAQMPGERAGQARQVATRPRTLTLGVDGNPRRPRAVRIRETANAKDRCDPGVRRSAQRPRRGGRPDPRDGPHREALCRRLRADGRLHPCACGRGPRHPRGERRREVNIGEHRDGHDVARRGHHHGPGHRADLPQPEDRRVTGDCHRAPAPGGPPGPDRAGEPPGGTAAIGVRRGTGQDGGSYSSGRGGAAGAPQRSGRVADAGREAPAGDCQGLRLRAQAADPRRAHRSAGWRCCRPAVPTGPRRSARRHLGHLHHPPAGRGA